MNITYSKQIPVRYEADVFVAGGGPAGISAAVAAARYGRSVFLAESGFAAGGAAVNMLVPAFMPFGDRVNFYAGGIGREVYDRIASEAPERFRTWCPDGIPVETLKLIYDDMLSASGCRVAFGAEVIDAVTEQGKVTHAVLSAREGVYAVKADVFIDATGDGLLCERVGARTEYGDENGLSMAATLCALWAGFEFEKFEYPPNKYVDRAIEDGVFTNHDRHLPGIWPILANHPGVLDGVGGSNAGHVYGVDPRSSESLTPAIMQARKQLMEYRRYFREYMPGCENAEIIFTAPMLGIRESRRVECDYRLNVEDFKRQAVFDDEIGRFNYGVDIHSSTNDRAGYEKFVGEYYSLRYKDGESYGIPLRSLIVKGFDNLLCAGRCICTDRYMLSSVRVMPGCFITGQAAGVAAAQTLEQRARDVRLSDVGEIKEKLKRIGAFLPNAKGS
ncbi:MAG: FAD-dependent oxidoreductase [Clostridiales bacterium]|nr:FAD-dependent oxidoreductase [Clostridiales bacterium]